jgi:hypothetical protein
MRGRTRLCTAASIAALAALAACSSTQTSMTAPTADKCQVSATSTPSAFAASGGQGSLNITTARDCTWAITTEASWVAISGTRDGQGEASVAYTVSPNPVPSARSAMVMIGSQGVPVNQAAAPCTFTLNHGGDAIGSAGGRLSVDVATIAGCAWTAASDSAWITITSGQSGAASATVALSVAPNAGAARVGRVNIGGQNYTVNQDAVPVAPPPAAPAPNPPAPSPAPTPTPAPSPTPTPAPAPTPGPTPSPKPSPTPAPPPQPAPKPAPPPPADTVNFDGDVAGLSGRCPSTTFTVDGQSIVTDGSTDFKKSECGDLRNGRGVSGKGTTQPDGSVKATQIQVDKHDR